VTSIAAPASPAAGNSRVARVTTITGPAMQMTSSRTDSSAYAVCTAAPPPSRAAHRARTIAGTCGKAAPAGTAAANRAHRGPHANSEAVLALMRKYTGPAKRGDLLTLLFVTVVLAAGLLTNYIL
jgi:hypothetical protein